MLARDLGCTVEELGQRMSAEEFGMWQVMYDKEQLHPVTGRSRHAQLLAGQMQGPSSRKDKKPWTAEQFMVDPWAQMPVRPIQTVSIGDQVKAMNKRRRRNH